MYPLFTMVIFHYHVCFLGVILRRIPTSSHPKTQTSSVMSPNVTTHKLAWHSCTLSTKSFESTSSRIHKMMLLMFFFCALGIMGSQNSWFGDPRKKTSKQESHSQTPPVWVGSQLGPRFLRVEPQIPGFKSWLIGWPSSNIQ